MSSYMRLIPAVVVVFVLRAQSVEPRPSFEVVSIRPTQRPGPLRIDPGRISWAGVAVRSLITQAYDIASYQINGPTWLDEPHYYDFSATIPEGVSRQQIPAMLQTMLAERFGLKVHWETQVQPVYALIVGKGGSKLHPADLAKAAIGADGKPADSLDVSASGHVAFRTTTTAWLARYLSRQLGRPVLDLTGIPGIFDFEFDTNPSDLDALRRMSAAGSPADDSLAPSLFTGVQSLGLKLESRKAPIEHLIIDDVLKVPTGN
jgi:uncharacterized protein (TIGR03435 family)